MTTRQTQTLAVIAMMTVGGMGCIGSSSPPPFTTNASDSGGAAEDAQITGGDVHTPGTGDPVNKPDTTDPVICDDDGDPCTDALVFEGACIHLFSTAPCDDGDLCTVDDTCAEGACTGAPMDCDDGKPCTLELCNDEGACYSVLAPSTEECVFSITVTTPTRAATIMATGGTVAVAGAVNSPAGAVTSLKMNGVPLELADNGTFSTIVPANIGINLLEFFADNVWGQQATVAQSFLYADALHAVGSADAPTIISGGMGFWASEAFFDDDDPDPDDIATFVELAIASFDLAGAVPPKIKDSDGLNPKAGPCEWEVTTHNVQATFDNLDLDPVQGGLKAQFTFVNLYIALDAKSGQLLCPDESGHAAVDTVVADAVLNLQVVDGALSTSLVDVDVKLSSLDLSLDWVTGFLFNWLIDFFEESLREMIEEEIEEMIPDMIVPMLSDVLTDLGTTETSFEIAPGVDMTTNTGLEGARFLPSGLDLTMRFGAVVEKHVAFDSPGSLAWTGCAAGSPVSGAAVATADGTIGAGAELLPHASTLEAFFREDIANQLLFALWWGGAAQVPVTVVDQAGAGLEKLEASVQLLLPPVVTSCTDGGDLEFQLGDLQVLATFEFLGTPGAFEAYVSAGLAVDLAVVDLPDSGPALGVSGLTLEAISMDVVVSEGLPVLSPEVLEEMFGKVVVEAVADALLEQTLSGYPLPEIDIGGAVPGMQAGTVLKLSPGIFTTLQGHLLIGGNLLAQ